MDEKPISVGTRLSRALKLVCPECGNAPVFRGWLRTRPSCESCGFRFEREPGYFLGSIYFNYGAVAIIGTAAHVTMNYGLNASATVQYATILPFMLIAPLWLFRYARAFWMALDLSFDPPAEKEFEGDR